MERQDAGVTTLIAVVGETDALQPRQAEALGAVALNLIKRLRSAAPQSRFAVLTLARTQDERVVANALARNGCEAWIPVGATPLEEAARTLPAEFCGLDSGDPGAEIEALCRYSHLLISVTPANTAADSLRARVTSAWRNNSFHFGDDEADDEQLIFLEAPPAGELISLALPPSDFEGKLHRKDFVGADQLRRVKHALAEFNRFNAALIAASPAAALERSANLRRKGQMSEAHNVSEDVAFATSLSLFGQASAQARAAKNGVDVFNFVYAGAPAAAVLLYEYARANYPGTNWALWLYLGAFGVLIGFAWVLTVRGIHWRMLNARGLAELVRTQLFWRLCGVDARLETSIRRWAPGVSPVLEAGARSLDFIVASAPRVQPSDAVFFTQAWIGTQINYHREFSSKHALSAERLEQLQFSVVMIAFGLAFALLTVVGLSAFRLPITLEAMAISGLPAIAGGIAILRERFSYRVLAENYSRMLRLARSALQKLERTPQNAVHISEQFGRETIKESTEWMQVHRQRRANLESLFGG